MNEDPSGYVAKSITSNYFTIMFNNWETNMIINAITLSIEAVGLILAIVAAVPTLGISTAIGGAICKAGGFVFGVFKFMNLCGGNKGLNINLSRKWYLINYIGINRYQPNGYQNIWQVFEAVKKSVKKIINKVGIAIVRRISQKSRTNRVSVLAKMIYDYYYGRRVVRWNYRIS